MTLLPLGGPAHRPYHCCSARGYRVRSPSLRPLRTRPVLISGRSPMEAPAVIAGFRPLRCPEEVAAPLRGRFYRLAAVLRATWARPARSTVFRRCFRPSPGHRGPSRRGLRPHLDANELRVPPRGHRRTQPTLYGPHVVSGRRLRSPIGPRARRAPDTMPHRSARGNRTGRRGG